MSDREPLSGAPDPEDGPEDLQDQEIEVTGIVGMSPDAPPPSAHERPGRRPDDEDGDEDDPAAGDELSRLRVRMEQLQEELLRARADFDNLRKRQVREREEYTRHAAAELVGILLPVLDNFKRAMQVDSDSEGYGDGIRMIYEQLSQELERAGLRPIPTTGEPFDPNHHEAVAREETTEVEENQVTAEIEPGYWFRDRLLKAARVRVSVRPPS